MLNAMPIELSYWSYVAFKPVVFVGCARKHIHVFTRYDAVPIDVMNVTRGNFVIWRSDMANSVSVLLRLRFLRKLNMQTWAERRVLRIGHPRSFLLGRPLGLP